MTDEELMEKVYNGCIEYLSQREVPLPLTSTKQDIRAALQTMIANVRAIDPATFFPEGELREALPPLYLWKLFFRTVQEIDRGNEEAVKELEQVLRGEVVPGNA